MFSRSNSPAMKFICVTLLIISGITDSRSEQYEVVGPADPVLAVAGEDVILPCSVKPNTSVVDMRVEWFRLDLIDSQLVHLYEDHVDKNTNQIESYRGRTKLNHQELQRGNASLKLSSVRVSDEGLYKCFIQSKSWYDDAIVNVSVEGNMFNSWRTSVILISVFVVLSVIAGILIAVFAHKNKERDQLLKTILPKGCFYFEVQVKGQTEWDLGVTRQSANRKGWISLSPDNGYWIVGRRDGEYQARDSPDYSFSLSVNPQRVGVFVDYEKGLVCFYDVESMSHIYSYTDQCFNEKLYPFVCLGYWSNGNSTPLIICDD
ncbi:butyrophilin subfamily 1 member A1-like isoform X1 [Labeo rohita]|uniref:Butyrophilin subfamily 1 member A1-like isoform X1 n=1 Tax=Labeo rohita TaxID=84645 RepID=A0A498N8Z3_LABRO|nr:butyrophilin subfamily 1 member A1-like isoform X1 [Labeo rohita]